MLNNDGGHAAPRLCLHLTRLPTRSRTTDKEVVVGLRCTVASSRGLLCMLVDGGHDEAESLRRAIVFTSGTFP